MVWMMDTYINTGATYEKNDQRAVVTGKTINSGGSEGREKATGQGVVHCIKEWSREHRFDLEGATAIVQGFGNVGSNAALLLAKLGVSTIATGDHTGYLRNEEGFNAHKLQEYVRANGSIEGYPRGEQITRDEFFETPPTSSFRLRSRTRSVRRRPMRFKSGSSPKARTGRSTRLAKRSFRTGGFRSFPMFSRTPVA